MRVIYGTDKDSIGLLICGYYARNTGYALVGPFSAMAWLNDKGEMLGQAIFNNYTGANIDIHIHGHKCITRRTLKDAYNYAFNVAKCERLTAKFPIGNEKLSCLLSRLGFVYECTQEAYFKENGHIVDAVVYKLLKKDIPKWVM